MRILILTFALAVLPAPSFAQEGAGRGAPVPARAVREAAAARRVPPSQPDARASQSQPPRNTPSHPGKGKQPSGS
jgi:hypothetical protein